MNREQQDERITDLQEKIIDLINEEMRDIEMMQEAVFISSTALAEVTSIVVVSQIPAGTIEKAPSLIDSYIALFRDSAEQVLEQRKAELASELN